MRKKSNSDFIVIAGPNGAGKSTTSKKLLEPFGLIAFDWDIKFQEKWSKFSFDPLVIEGVRKTTNEEFQVYINFAFDKNESVAYETNFHSNYNFELASQSKSKGYSNSLYFLALDSVETCIQRVAERVKKGGHNVSEHTIRERFNIGFQRLDNEAPEYYDKIFIYDSSDKFRLLLIIEDRKLVYQADSLNPDIIKRLPKIKSLLG